MKRVLIVIIILPIYSYSQNWVALNSFPGSKRDDAVAFVAGDKAYVGTGIDNGFSVTIDFYAYSFKNNSWTQVANLPGPARQYAVACAIQDKGFVFGGIDASGVFLNDAYLFNPSTNAWTTLATLPAVGRAASAIFSFDNAIYIFGGRTSTSYLSEVWKYELQNNSWTQLNDFIGGARAELYATKIGSRLFLGSGVDASWNCYSDWYEYFPLEDLYVVKRDFIHTSCFYAVSMDNGVVGGGITTGLTYEKSFYHYQVESDSWKILPEITSDAVKGCSGFYYDGDYYVTTGISSSNQRSDSLYKLTSLYSSPSNHLQVPLITNGFLEYDLSNPIQDAFVHLYTMDGKVMCSKKIEGYNKHIHMDVSQLPAGFYVLQVIDEKTVIKTFKCAIFH